MAGLTKFFRGLQISILLIPICSGASAAQSPIAYPGVKLVKEIRIVQLRYTREEIVRRELKSKVGEPYSDGNLAEDRMRLDRLKIFSSIIIDVQEEPDGMVLELELRETFPFLPTASVEVSRSLHGGNGVGESLVRREPSLL